MASISGSDMIFSRHDNISRCDAVRYPSLITLTWAATTNQPSGKRTQVCICRPTLPGMVARWNRVEAIAKSRP